MSMTPASRTSLADLIVLVSHADLPGRRREELRSAVRTVARLLGPDPAAIAADPAALRRRLTAIAPEAHGMSRGRWANIRSLLVQGARLGAPDDAWPEQADDIAGVEGFDGSLPFSRSVRLVPLLRFLSARGRGPADVSRADSGRLSGCNRQRSAAQRPGEVLGSPGMGLELVPAQRQRLAADHPGAPQQACDLSAAMVGIPAVLQRGR